MTGWAGLVMRALEGRVMPGLVVLAMGVLVAIDTPELVALVTAVSEGRLMKV